MAVLSKFKSHHAVSFTCACALVTLYQMIKKKPNTNRDISSSSHCTKDSKKERPKKVAIDTKFIRNLLAILRILVPKMFSVETFYLLMIGGTLISRTLCDVWLIRKHTDIESSIISGKYYNFRSKLVQFLIATPLISFVTNLLKYSLSELTLRFRTRLTKSLYAQYLRGYTFYKMSNLDNRISNADHLLTQDVEKFCSSLVQLYSNILKPVLDICLYVSTLTSAIGIQGPIYMLIYLLFSGTILTKLRHPLGRMTVTEQELEAEFRFMNSRLITNSEEIAFYQGSDRERRTLMQSFQKMVNHLRKLLRFRFSMGIVDNIITKYIATVVGFVVMSRPFMKSTDNSFINRKQSDVMEDYYKNGRMLLKLAEAIGRLALAGREMNKLAGFTARVTDLLKVLDDLYRGQYIRTQMNDSSLNDKKDLDGLTLSGHKKYIPGSGLIIVQDNIIKFDRVPLITPNGDLLIEELSFEVRSGKNVLVCGPNGCGKSSLFRILGELWPLFGGTMIKPAKGKLFYIPQRPYMAVGSLRDQVIYPDTKDDMNRKGISDSDLEKYLDTVQLTYVLSRENGWDAVQDWMDVLSGGEKQRIAMARLFYHSPQFAILDECTSAVSVDVEGTMYKYCRTVGITLFTVSHRKSLWEHHDFYLRMDGRGNYEFRPIDENSLEFGS